jgi:hypothetical protein
LARRCDGAAHGCLEQCAGLSRTAGGEHGVLGDVAAERGEAAVRHFSWEPDRVEVLESGNFALSTGLVKNPEGVVTARFNSIWRRQPGGRWLVVFDEGGPP